MSQHLSRDFLGKVGRSAVTNFGSANQMATAIAHVADMHTLGEPWPSNILVQVIRTPTGTGDVS